MKRNRNVPTIVQAPISAVETITIAFWRFRAIAAIAKTTPTTTPTIQTNTSRSAPNRPKKPATRLYPSEPAIRATAKAQNR